MVEEIEVEKDWGFLWVWGMFLCCVDVVFGWCVFYLFLGGGGVVVFLEEVEGDGGWVGVVFWGFVGCVGEVGVDGEESCWCMCVELGGWVCGWVFEEVE